MTKRRSSDLDAPPEPREARAPLPANVRDFSLIIPPDVVIKIAQEQSERSTTRAVARHERRTRRGRPRE